MRVRISYGVDIEDVPERIGDILQSSAEKINDSMRLIKRVLEDLKECEDDCTRALESIDKIRKLLSEADLSMADAQSITGALNNYYNGDENVPDRRSTMDSGGNTTTQTTNPGEG